MKTRIDIFLKVDTPEQAASTLEELAQSIRNSTFEKYPNDLREFEDDDGAHGFSYETSPNDGTDIYGNPLGDAS